jgi:recombination protein RecR
VYPKSIQKLIDLFSKFPTVGPRTASRFVFYLKNADKKEVKELLTAIINLKKNIKTCSFCFNTFEPAQISSKIEAGKGEGHLCSICLDSRTSKNLLCVVEKESDLISLEKTRKYKGLYFILGGTISRLKKDDLDRLRTKELIERIKNPQKFGIPNLKIEEVILAINPTTEGEATILYLERLLKPLGIKTTRLGRGLPLGAELEYADEETLGSALEGRK